jgi:hypothetical protein
VNWEEVEESKIKFIMFAVRLIDSSSVVQIKFAAADFVPLMMLEVESFLFSMVGVRAFLANYLIREGPLS